MTDTKAPERIWMDPKGEVTLAGSLIFSAWDRKGGFARVEYVRADLHDATKQRDELAAEVERLTNNVNRFPALMERIKAAKDTPLSERIASVIAAVEEMPDGFGNYQWEADERCLFGDRWIRSVAGNDGRGKGRQAIAVIPHHLAGVARYIAAANPDTVMMLIAEKERLREALQWYANPANWCDSPDWDGPDTSTPKAVPIRIEEEMGPMICDCGDTARAALSGDEGGA